VNIVLLDETDFIAVDRVRLTDRRLRHVREVHRAAVGDALQVGLIDSEIGVGTVIELDESGLTLDVRFSQPPPAPAPVRLLLALPRRGDAPGTAGRSGDRREGRRALNSWRGEELLGPRAPPALREQPCSGRTGRRHSARASSSCLSSRTSCRRCSATRWAWSRIRSRRSPARAPSPAM
jgi:hypothetical protein